MEYIFKNGLLKGVQCEITERQDNGKVKVSYVQNGEILHTVRHFNELEINLFNKYFEFKGDRCQKRVQDV